MICDIMVYTWYGHQSFSISPLTYPVSSIKIELKIFAVLVRNRINSKI